VVLGPAASGTRGATSASAALGAGGPSAGRQLAPEWPCLAAATWHSRLQNHTPRHRPQRSSLLSLLPHAWREPAAGASDAESTPGAVVLGSAASGTGGATSALTASGACGPSAGRQLAPEWPCLAAAIWHSRGYRTTQPGSDRSGAACTRSCRRRGTRLAPFGRGCRVETSKRWKGGWRENWVVRRLRRRQGH